MAGIRIGVVHYEHAQIEWDGNGAGLTIGQMVDEHIKKAVDITSSGMLHDITIMFDATSEDEHMRLRKMYGEVMIKGRK